MKLTDNARIAIIGGGPSGSMAGFFLLELAERYGLRIRVDLYETRDFKEFGPPGCNMCAGVVSESLVQTLAAEGINLPPLVVQRGIDAYVLHTTGLAPVHIPTPANDLRIATVFRGAGPQPSLEGQYWGSFDYFLLDLARQRGVNIIRERVINLEWNQDRPQLHFKNHPPETYDLLIGAVGVNSPLLKSFESLGFRFAPPKTSRAFVSEIYLGANYTRELLGSSMHIFLLDLPRIKFAAIIPKVEYVTITLLGNNIDRPLVKRFLDTPEVRSCLPPDFDWTKDLHQCGMGEACHCSPKLNMGLAGHPYTNRVVLIGDSAISRLYKDGIGSAYITAKACAVTSIFLGISEKDYQQFYWPVVHRIGRDNQIGSLIFLITLLYQKLHFMRRGMVRMVQDEQPLPPEQRAMSRVLWDTFTGSSTYKEIFLKSSHPAFLYHLASATLRSFWNRQIKA